MPEGNNIWSSDFLGLTTAQATSTKKSVDLTTLSGWSSLADGEHNITIKAKATGYRDSNASDSVVVTKSSGVGTTIEAGTYVIKEIPSINTEVEANLNGKMNTLTDDNTYGEMIAFDSMYANLLTTPIGITLQILQEEEGNMISWDGDTWKYIYDSEYTATDTTKLRTIVIEADQEVSQEFKEWWDENTTKQTAVTHTLSWDDGQYTIVVDSHTVKDANNT